jgi:hypothetical protein
MIERFLPDERQASAHTIDYQKLWQRGIRGLVFDLDNTLGPHRFTEFDKKSIELVSQLCEQGFQVACLSNHNGTGREKLQTYLNKKSIRIIFNAKKPLPSGYKKILTLFGFSAEQTAMIGDQLFTDIWGAKRSGFYTILVNPVAPESDPLSIRARRWLEKLLLR